MVVRLSWHVSGRIESARLERHSLSEASPARMPLIPAPEQGGATTNANVLDAQVGYETGVSVMSTALSGGEAIAEGITSAIENTRLSVCEQAVIGNEICGMVYRILRGIEVNPDTLAVDVIREAGEVFWKLKRRRFL